MLTHKEVNTFIRKYNKQVVIKGYSNMKLANKIALVERRIKENKGGKYGLEVEARLEWAKMKKDKGIVDEDREARKKAFFQKKKRGGEEGQAKSCCQGGQEKGDLKKIVSICKMTKVSDKTLLKGLTVKELRLLAKTYNADTRIKNIHKMRKATLVEVLFKASKENAALRKGMKVHQDKNQKALAKFA